MNGSYQIEPDKIMGLRFASRKNLLFIFLFILSIFLLGTLLKRNEEDLLTNLKVLLIVFGGILLLGLLITTFVGFSIEGTTLKLDDKKVTQLYHNEIAVSIAYDEIQEIKDIDLGFLIIKQAGTPRIRRSFHLHFFKDDQIFVPGIIEDYDRIRSFLLKKRTSVNKL